MGILILYLMRKIILMILFKMKVQKENNFQVKKYICIYVKV